MPTLSDTYRDLLTIRLFEERIVALKGEGRVVGSLHLCCGQEAIPVGACRVLEDTDALTVTYRGHGWAIARGIPLAHLFGELMGRDSPLCGGRAGSAYFLSAEHGLLGENSIVGAGVPIALGAALAGQLDGRGSVSLCSIGDGAMNQGAVHEALNFAAYKQLPLVVVVENNCYSELTPIGAMIRTETLAERAPAYGIPGVRIDGNEVDPVQVAVAEAVDRARNGDGPTLIEAMTERLVGHYDGDLQHYRPQGEIEAAMETEPLARLRARLGPRDVEQVEHSVGRALELALHEAEAYPLPDIADARQHVFA